ncbi:MAG: 4-vinyl reductase [Chloroflexota bacterium]
MDRVIDGVWDMLLARVAKKEIPVARPSLGDGVDLYVPQVRTLLLLQDDPSLAFLIFQSSYLSAQRNAFSIMRKLGMPPDYFWRYEYWPKERAFETLKRVINKVFSAMMNQSKEGLLDISDVDVEKMRFSVSFRECAECAGVTANQGICFYHGGTFSGIIASLINKDLTAFETRCQAKGDDGCNFTIGSKEDPEMKDRASEYLSPPNLELKLDERLTQCLSSNLLRGLGSEVYVGYYQLLLANSMMSDPTHLVTASFEAGAAHGAKLAPIIADFYKESRLEVIKKYYRQLHQLEVRTIEVDSQIDIILGECAEIALLKKKELLSFLFGEFQGLVSGLLNRDMVFKESVFEDGDLRVKLVPRAG